MLDESYLFSAWLQRIVIGRMAKLLRSRAIPVTDCREFARLPYLSPFSQSL